MILDELLETLKQAIIEAYKAILNPFENLVDSITDYYESMEDIAYFDSDDAVNKVSLLLKHLTLHSKMSKVCKKKYKRIYMRQKIP